MNCPPSPGDIVLGDFSCYEHNHASSIGVILGDPEDGLRGREIIAGRPLDGRAVFGGVEVDDTYPVGLLRKLHC